MKNKLSFFLNEMQRKLYLPPVQKLATREKKQQIQNKTLSVGNELKINYKNYFDFQKVIVPLVS